MAKLPTEKTGSIPKRNVVYIWIPKKWKLNNLFWWESFKIFGLEDKADVLAIEHTTFRKKKAAKAFFKGQELQRVAIAVYKAPTGTETEKIKVKPKKAKSKRRKLKRKRKHAKRNTVSK